jgi:uncharacterized repeat protein (TIGR01451 family)
MNWTMTLMLPVLMGQAGPQSTLFQGPRDAGVSRGIVQAPSPEGFAGPPRLGCPSVTVCPTPSLAAAPVPCPPNQGPAPLLAGRVLAPAGVKVTVYPGTAMAQTYATPATFGFRHGYSYRLALSQLPGRPGETIYPVLEVRGSLIPRPTTPYMAFPAPILISARDIERALNGGVVTKVIYLEDPEKATPVQTSVDAPLEFTDNTVTEAFAAANDQGRLVAVLRIGDRRPEAEVLQATAVANTILLPGENRLAAPSVPPHLASVAVPLYDPLIGPKIPAEECFVDGCDKGPRLGIGPGLRLGGLNVTDVAAEYTILDKRRVATSNLVCLCVPRFAIRRVETGLVNLETTVGPQFTEQQTSQLVVSNTIPPQAVVARVKPVEVDGAIRPAQQIGREGINVAVHTTAPKAIATSIGTAVAAAAVAPEELNLGGPFVITKEVSPDGVIQIGDVVTFTLRYRNNTKLPITDVVISDSLSPRLAYIAGSASSDRPANVSTTENEAGSVIVRFELPGTLPPGQGGMVKFQARVR